MASAADGRILGVFMLFRYKGGKEGILRSAATAEFTENGDLQSFKIAPRYRKRLQKETICFYLLRPAYIFNEDKSEVWDE